MGRVINLVGFVFNWLTVKEQSNKRYSNGDILWECQCICGNIILANKHQLTSGNTQSCGCKRKQTQQNKFIDLKGKQFGQLTVLSKSEQGKTQCYWVCKCSCGTIKHIASGALRYGKVVSCGCKKVKVLQHLAKLHRISKKHDPNKLMKPTAHNILCKIKTQILKRDSFSCVLCKTTEKLNIHHIVPYNETPLLLNSTSNLITLCYNCHKKAHGGNWKLVDRAIQEKLKRLVLQKTIL